MLQPHSGPTPARPARTCAAAALLLISGCMSPEEAVDAADDQVYALVAERRAELMPGEDELSIHAPTDSLRQRLLDGNLTAGESVVSLNLKDCLEIASENNRQYQTQRESLYLSALDLTLERWRFGWQPTVSASASVGSISGNDETGSINPSGRLTRLFGNGGQLVLDIGAALVGAIAEGEGWDALSNLGVSWSQPILRGSAREVVLEPLTQAERNLTYAVRNFERFRRTFALDVASRYYQLALARQSVLNERTNIEVLDLLSLRNQAFAEAGKLSDLEASEAAQDLISSQNRLLSLEANFEKQLDNFKFFMGLPIDAEIGIDSEGLTELTVGSKAFDVTWVDEQALFELALMQRLDYLNEVEQIVDNERSARIAADDLKVGLDLSAGLSGSSELDRPLAYKSDGSTWNIGLDLDLPVDQLPERNSYRSALIRLQAGRRSLIETQDNILAEIRDALRELKLAELTYNLQVRTLPLNERRARSANMNLEAGRLETDRFLNAQRDLTAARNAFVSAQVDFTLARLQLLQDLELLTLDKNGLVVDWSPIQARLRANNLEAENEDGE
ncbi:MAG: TolC family protein [Planctomycetes bacterium]|nr:TolC family protein [Planctomycetota bacterium]